MKNASVAYSLAGERGSAGSVNLFADMNTGERGECAFRHLLLRVPGQDSRANLAIPLRACARNNPFEVWEGQARGVSVHEKLCPQPGEARLGRTVRYCAGIGAHRNARVRSRVAGVLVLVGSRALLRRGEALDVDLHGDRPLPEIASASSDIEEFDHGEQVRVECETARRLTRREALGARGGPQRGR